LTKLEPLGTDEQVGEVEADVRPGGNPDFYGIDIVNDDASFYVKTGIGSIRSDIFDDIKVAQIAKAALELRISKGQSPPRGLETYPDIKFLFFSGAITDSNGTALTRAGGGLERLDDKVEELRMLDALTAKRYSSVARGNIVFDDSSLVEMNLELLSEFEFDPTRAFAALTGTDHLSR